MAIRKPGRMRWTYTSPERKVFVSDGVKLYSYVPADKQVYVATVPTGDDASTPALFLAGKGHLTRDFTAAPAAPAGAPSGSAAIKLTPVKPEREYETLVLVVDRTTLQWRMLVTADRQGGTSTFAFTNLRENTGVPDSEFRLHDSPRRRCDYRCRPLTSSLDASCGRWRGWSWQPRLPAGCATSSALRDGRAAERADDYDRAVVEYTKALKEHPDSFDARQALDRAKLRAAELHFARGRRLYATGKFEEALVELQLASEMNPSSGEIDAELRRARVGLRTKLATPIDGKTRLEALVERSRDMQPAGLELPRDVKLPSSAMVFRDAGVRDVLTIIARLANVNVVFDPAFRDAPITIELREPEFEVRFDIGDLEHAQLLQSHRAAHHHDRARHARQAP